MGNMVMREVWTNQEVDFLRSYYVVYGPQLCAEKLHRSTRSIYSKANSIGIKIRGWSDEDMKFLKNHFCGFGLSKCAVILGKKKTTTQAMARKLGLKTDKSCGRPKKEIIARISDKRAIMTCKHHGCTEFYIKPNGTSMCLICLRANERKVHKRESYKLKRRRWVNARRRTPLGNYEHRLRSLLRHAMKGKASYTKDLPYSSIELCDHLETTRTIQNNKCPMCGISYDDIKHNIDHIIPVSSANSEEELLQLFDLSNLSLLCFRCNQHVKKDKIGVSCG